MALYRSIYIKSSIRSFSAAARFSSLATWIKTLVCSPDTDALYVLTKSAGIFTV